MAIDIPMRVAFDDCDSGGIVFFGNYLRFAHRALEQFLPQIGIAWEAWYADKKLGVPIRHAEVDYLTPLRPGEAMTLRVSVKNVGQSAVTFNFVILKVDGSVAGTVETVHVFVDLKAVKSHPIPETIKKSLQAQLVR